MPFDSFNIKDADWGNYKRITGDTQYPSITAQTTDTPEFSGAAVVTNKIRDRFAKLTLGDTRKFANKVDTCTIAISSTSTIILSSDVTRKGYKIFNRGLSPAFLHEGSSTAATSANFTGIVLPGELYISNTFWTGDVKAICSVSEYTNLNVSDFTSSTTCTTVTAEFVTTTTTSTSTTTTSTTTTSTTTSTTTTTTSTSTTTTTTTIASTTTTSTTTSTSTSTTSTSTSTTSTSTTSTSTTSTSTSTTSTSTTSTSTTSTSTSTTCIPAVTYEATPCAGGPSVWIEDPLGELAMFGYAGVLFMYDDLGGTTHCATLVSLTTQNNCPDGIERPYCVGFMDCTDCNSQIGMC